MLEAWREAMAAVGTLSGGIALGGAGIVMVVMVVALGRGARRTPLTYALVTLGITGVVSIPALIQDWLERTRLRASLASTPLDGQWLHATTSHAERMRLDWPITALLAVAWLCGLALLFRAMLHPPVPDSSAGPTHLEPSSSTGTPSPGSRKVALFNLLCIVAGVALGVTALFDALAIDAFFVALLIH